MDIKFVMYEDHICCPNFKDANSENYLCKKCFKVYCTSCSKEHMKFHEISNLKDYIEYNNIKDDIKKVVKEYEKISSYIGDLKIIESDELKLMFPVLFRTINPNFSIINDYVENKGLIDEINNLRTSPICEHR